MQLEIPKQRELLRSAVIGHAFAPAVRPTKFQSALKDLRILGTLRKVGLSPSYRQFRMLGYERVIARLLALYQHFLAKKISKFLDLSEVYQWLDRECECYEIMAYIDDLFVLFDLLFPPLSLFHDCNCSRLFSDF